MQRFIPVYDRPVPDLLTGCRPDTAGQRRALRVFGLCFLLVIVATLLISVWP
ncbi:MAG: hypothetical protein WC497_02110 [Patescibacteria group bacterium]